MHVVCSDRRCRYHLLSLDITCYRLISIDIIRYHSISLDITRYHLISLDIFDINRYQSISFDIMRHHSISFDVIRCPRGVAYESSRDPQGISKPKLVMSEPGAPGATGQGKQRKNLMTNNHFVVKTRPTYGTCRKISHKRPPKGPWTL